LQLVAYGDKRAIEEARKDLFSDSSFVLTGEFFVEGKVPQWKMADISEYSDMPMDQLRKEIESIFGDEFAKFAFGPYGFSTRYEAIPSHSKDMLKRILLHVKNLKQELAALENKENLTAEEKKQMNEINTLISFIRITSEDHGNMCPNRLVAMVNVMGNMVDTFHVQPDENGGIKEKYFDPLSQEVRFDAARLGFVEFCKIITVPEMWSAEYKNFYDFVVRHLLAIEHIDKWTLEMMEFYLVKWPGPFCRREFSIENVLKSLRNVYAPTHVENPPADGANPPANAVPVAAENAIIGKFIGELRNKITVNEVAKKELTNELNDKKMPPIGEYQKLLKLDEANIAAKIDAVKGYFKDTEKYLEDTEKTLEDLEKNRAAGSSTDVDSDSAAYIENAKNDIESTRNNIKNTENILEWMQANQARTPTFGEFDEFLANAGIKFTEYRDQNYNFTIIKLFLLSSGFMALQQQQLQQQLLPLLQQQQAQQQPQLANA
jgi:hypothetical protein